MSGVFSYLLNISLFVTEYFTYFNIYYAGTGVVDVG